MTNYELSQRLKALAKENQISMKCLLEKCNINRNFIYDLEHKEATPSSKTLVLLANELNVSVEYLLGLTDKKEKPTADGGERSAKLTLLNALLEKLSDEQLDKVLDYFQVDTDGK